MSRPTQRPAKKSGYNHSRPATPLHNERRARCAHRKRRDRWIASPRTRRRFGESLRARGGGTEPVLVDKISVVVAYAILFRSLCTARDSPVILSEAKDLAADRDKPFAE